MKKAIKFRKRCAGILFFSLVSILFFSNKERDITYTDTMAIDNFRICEALESFVPVPYTKYGIRLDKTTPLPVAEAKKTVAKPKMDKDFYDKRYSGIKKYPPNDYIESVIKDLYPTVKDLSKKAKINPRITMCQIIIESVDARNRKFSDLAEQSFNFMALKDKGDDPYFSPEFKELLAKVKKNDTHWKKDDCKDGKKCPFYVFNSRWAGLRANTAFVGDRIKNHPAYIKAFEGINVDDDRAYAYAIYSAGYAQINTSSPYDLKLIRVLEQYRHCMK
jgi:predicted nucleic acid-binding protein